MNTEFKIESFCSIKNHQVSINNSVLFEDREALAFSDFIKKAYKKLNTQYTKFFKMDQLSKLAFLTADVLLRNSGITSDQEHNIALVFSNKASSIDTDRKHQNTIQNQESYYPSPAVFVYTLPNICLGEISIKYKLYSENSFFIFDHFNTKHLMHYANELLETNTAEKVLCGWVEFDKDNYHSLLYLVSKKGEIDHTITEIIKLYNQ
ncbi:MAG: 3-oxoacyl-ACP synthase [Flavobacteriales bacterium]